MIRPLVRRVRQAGIRTRVRKAIDAGVGVYNRTWPLNAGVAAPAPEEDSRQPRVRALSLQVLDWCRLTMGQMRKPYGLDYVSLVIAVIGAKDRELAEVNFGVLRPHEFYGDESVGPRIEETLAEWQEQGLLSAQDGAPSAERPRLAALLFSWGDLTRELLLAG